MVGAGDVLQRRRARALQEAVEKLPVESRRAMLVGLGEGPIIAGAYKVGPAQCPGLAAYRHGARTGYTDFAKAWDRYVRGRGVRRVRDDDLSRLVEMLRAGLPPAPGTNGHGPSANGNGNGAAASTNGNGAVHANGNGALHANGNGAVHANGNGAVHANDNGAAHANGNGASNGDGSSNGAARRRSRSAPSA